MTTPKSVKPAVKPAAPAFSESGNGTAPPVDPFSGGLTISDSNVTFSAAGRDPERNPTFRSMKDSWDRRHETGDPTHGIVKEATVPSGLSTKRLIGMIRTAATDLEVGAAIRERDNGDGTTTVYFRAKVKRQYNKAE